MYLCVVLMSSWIALDWSQVTTGARLELATENMAQHEDDGGGDDDYDGV